MGTKKEHNLGMFATNVELKEDASIDFISNGGGGYGNPLLREPEKVLDEVIDGFLTVEGAADAYGVVIEATDPDIHDYRIDEKATDALRKKKGKMDLPEGYGPGEAHPDGKIAGQLLADRDGGSTDGKGSG
jgi:hypothetical protein